MSSKNRKSVVVVDGESYNLDIFIKAKHEPVALVVVAYQQNELGRKILKLCLDSLLKFTTIPSSIWVIDNNSPQQHNNWLEQYPNINVIFNRSKYSLDDGYQNGVALEVAKQILPKETKYIFTMHMDTVVCRKGWLAYLVSKMSKKVRSVGVRMDRARTKAGILHSLGALHDFQLIRPPEFNFLPDLPKYDVGDKITVKIVEMGYDIFACRNTHTEPELVKTIPTSSPYRDFAVDRTFDDDGNIFFLHLGWGTGKSRKRIRGKTDVEEWLDFANNILLSESYSPNRLSSKEVEIQPRKPQYSIRRYYVDEFFVRNSQYFDKNSNIIDIGGKKKDKRGVFNIERYVNKVSYANLEPKTTPDYLCDVNNIPVKDSSFDGAILGELLEHIPEPKKTLKEAFRVVKKGGYVLVTVPFMYHIHADPYDFGRYTDYYWRKTAQEVGFTDILIERQGSIYAVMANLIKMWANVKLTSFGIPVRDVTYTVLSYIAPRYKNVAHNIPKNRKMNINLYNPVKYLFYFIILIIAVTITWILVKFCMYFENQPSSKKTQLYKANTLGFGLILRK